MAPKKNLGKLIPVIVKLFHYDALESKFSCSYHYFASAEHNAITPELKYWPKLLRGTRYSILSSCLQRVQKLEYLVE